MSVVSTDILGDLCGLSLGLIIAILPIGLLLWLFGWWSHRFWIVLTTTVLAGVFGLLEATSWGVQPILVAVLLAIAAGVMALALVRVIAFAAGGLASIYLVQFLFPSLGQHAIVFLVGGLLSLLLFRWYFMALTSFLGSLLVAYGTLAFMHYHEMFDALGWATDSATLLSILCGAAALIGFVFQLMFDRWRERRRREDDEEGTDFTSMILGRIGFGGKSREAA
jgi:MFS family permease